MRDAISQDIRVDAVFVVSDHVSLSQASVVTGSENPKTSHPSSEYVPAP